MRGNRLDAGILQICKQAVGLGCYATVLDVRVHGRHGKRRENGSHHYGSKQFNQGKAPWHRALPFAESRLPTAADHAGHSGYHWEPQQVAGVAVPVDCCWPAWFSDNWVHPPSCIWVPIGVAVTV